MSHTSISSEPNSTLNRLETIRHRFRMNVASPLALCCTIVLDKTRYNSYRLIFIFYFSSTIHRFFFCCARMVSFASARCNVYLHLGAFAKCTIVLCHNQQDGEMCTRSVQGCLLHFPITLRVNGVKSFHYILDESFAISAVRFSSYKIDKIIWNVYY